MFPIKPTLTGRDEYGDYDACKDFESAVYDYVDDNDEDVSDEQYDKFVSDINAAYDEYFKYYE